MNKEDEALVRRTYGGFMKDNLAEMEKFPDSYVHHLPGGRDIGSKEIKETVIGFLVAFPDFHITIEDIFSQGDKVVFRSTRTGTHKGERWGLPPSGKKVKWTYITICRIDGGKIVEEWGEGDYLGMFLQMGARISSGQK